MSLENIESDLVSYWPLEEPSGTRFDFTDLNNDLSDLNGVDLSVAIVGSGAHFTRANSECLNSDLSNGVLDFGDEDFTFALWVSLDSKDLPAQTLLSKHRPPSNDRQFFIDFVFGGIDRFRFLINSTGIGGSTTIIEADTLGSPSANTFYFIVAWHDSVANTINIQINDGGIDSAAHTGGAFQGDAAFKLGCVEDVSENPTALLNGILDEVVVWNRVLTSAEKTSLYNSGNGVNLQSVLTPVPTSGFFGGYMKGVVTINTSGLFGGYLLGKQETAISIFGGFLLAQATSEAQTLVSFGGCMSVELPFTSSGIFGGYMDSFISVPAETFGGLMVSVATNTDKNVGFFGGFIQGGDFTEVSGKFGGFMQAQPQTPVPPAFFGGIASGLITQQENFGGWIFGAPGADDFVEQHSRTLVKVRSEDVVDQGLDLDGELTLFQRDNANFRAKLGIESTGESQFHAKLSITKDKVTPTSSANVLKVTVSGVIEVTVEASGLPGEADSFFVSAQIDFGEPYDVTAGIEGQILRGGVAIPIVSGSISGFEFDQLNPAPTTSGFSNVVRASHIYNHPGRYIITTKFTDNLGMVHMQGFECDLLDDVSIASISGTVPVKGIDYPAIEISGLPRGGSVPGSLRIDYPMRSSGTGFTALENEVAKLNNTNTSSNDFINWNLGNGFTSTIKQPFTFYDAPGLYVPVLRYQFNHPSGIQTGVDASGVPVYGSRMIWLSESLLVGFNI